MWTALSHVLKKFIQYLHEGILLEKIHDRLCEYRYRTNFFVFYIYCILRGKYENLKGLDFSQPIQGIYNVADNRCDYWPSEKKYVYQALRKINFNNTLNFLDIGCGKGYVLYLAMKYPFQKICGIEYSQDIFNILKNNIRKLSSNNVFIFNIDARDFLAYGEYDVIYFFNPFGREIMKDVMRAITCQMLKNKVYTIIYYNPVCDDIIRENGIFHLKYELPISRGKKIYIYEGSRN